MAKKSETAFAVGPFTTVCMLIYMFFYGLESPIRYVLYLGGASSLILARDLLIDVPLAIILLRQLLNGKVHGAYKVFFAVLLISGTIFYLNFRVVTPVILGVKMVLNVLLGLVAGGGIVVLSQRMLRIFLALLIVSCIGLAAEKFLVTFPWVGLHDTIAGRDVELSRDWQVTDAFARRVGGFTRESIAAAGMVSVLALIVACSYRRLLARVAIIVPSIAAVFLTTQKGAFAALVVAGFMVCLPSRVRIPGLAALVILGAAAQILMPFGTSGMTLVHGSGEVYTASSLTERIVTTWPEALQWINDHSLFPFAVGMGGMGGPLRSLFAPAQWMFPDNMFILVYGFFGIFTVVFYFWLVYAAWRSLHISPRISEPAVAILAFQMLYGIVISILEDQWMALFLGASAGVLLNADLLSRNAPQLNPLRGRSQLARRAGSPGSSL